LRQGRWFVEPVELDIQCPIWGGLGAVCKQSGWVELRHAARWSALLRMSGIDPESGADSRWPGTARLVMRYGIDDIRQLQGGDPRFGALAVKFSTTDLRIRSRAD
jgi:phenylalanyl-tRNA synthetase alpha chain